MSYSSEVLADSPVLYLPLDETSGTSCADSSTNAFTGTTHGTITRNVTGQVSKAVSYGGTTADYIDVPDNAALDITGDFTFECWFSFTSLTAHQVLMDKGYQNGSTAGYCVFILTTGIVRLSQSDIANIADSSSAFSNDGNYHHLVITRSGTSIKFYFDKVLINTVTTGAGVQATTLSYYIGIGSGAAGLFRPVLSGGKLDEVAYYNSALSLARIQAHYDAAFNIDSVTISTKTTPSITETRDSVDSATISGKTTPSGVDVYTPPSTTDVATISSKTTPTGVDTKGQTDTATITSLTTFTSSELHGTSDSDIISTLTTFTSIDAGPYYDSGIINSVTTPAVLIELVTTTRITLDSGHTVGLPITATIIIDVPTGTSGSFVGSSNIVGGEAVSYTGPGGYWGPSDDDNGIIV